MPRIAVSGLGIGFLLIVGNNVFAGNYAEGAGFAAGLWALLALVIGGTMGYFLLAFVTDAFDLSELKAMLKISLSLIVIACVGYGFIFSLIPLNETWRSSPSAVRPRCCTWATSFG